jgi:hypothetical protein
MASGVILELARRERTREVGVRGPDRVRSGEDDERAVAVP